MSKTYLALKPSEHTVTLAAAQIYAVYLATGKVLEGDEQEWRGRAVAEAIHLAKSVSEVVVSETEMG